MTPKVHPFAARFPMLSDDEIADLAADIKANGLVYPIVLDADGQLIDGRNRLRACEIAGIDPTFTTLNGHDPVSYIWSTNIARRHLSKGQKTMLAAMAGLVFKTRSTVEVAKEADVERSQVSHAGIVLRYAPDLIDAVISGAVALNEAYEEARKRKAAATSTEAQIERLRADAPDLADQVVEERLTLRAALVELDERRALEVQRRTTATRQMVSLLTVLECGGTAPDESAGAWLAQIDFRLQQAPFALTRDGLERSRALFNRLIDGLEESL